MDEGYIRLATQMEQKIKSGRYTLMAEQTSTIPECRIEPAVFPFACGANPLSLPPGDVYSAYPPPKSFGNFDLTLPHVVFCRESLPWERTIPGVNGAPWLALLLFDETEETALCSLAASEAFAPTAHRYCPTPYSDDMDENCLVLDVPANLFSVVCPTAADLPLCAHVRCISRENKVTEEAPPGEWLSVLVGTRWAAGSSGPTGEKQTAYVVSLEHFGALLTDDSLRQSLADGKKYNTVRLPVLYSWDFYSAKNDFDFKTVFTSLDAGSLVLPLPEKEHLPEETANLLQMGFAPVDHQLREGSRTVSWYHGPLLPFANPIATAPPKPALSADEHLVYQPEAGMFDIAYSAAFSLGRQLGLQSGSFATALDNWRNENKTQANALQQQTMLLNTLGVTAANSHTAKGVLQDVIRHTVERAARQLVEGDGEDGK